MALKLIVTGLGGQGVVFITRVLARAATDLGSTVIGSETHGMSQRGGSVVSHLKLDGSEAPLVQRGTADVLLGLDAGEAVRCLTYLRRGGTAFVNAEDGLPPEVIGHLERLGIAVRALPATRLATELGTPAVTNVLLVGFAIAHPALPLPYDTVRGVVEAMAQHNLEVNLRALETGHRAGRREADAADVPPAPR